MKLTKEMCEEMFAQCDHHTQACVMAVIGELQIAKEKHPVWPIDRELEFKDASVLKDKSVADFVTAAAIVSEESGELIKAALQFHHEDGRYFDMLTEAVQVAATAIRFLTECPDINFQS